MPNKKHGQPIIRDDNYFRYLSPEPAPHELGIPEDCEIEIDLRTTREMVADRMEWLEGSVCCPTCAGKGRVPKP